MANKTLLAQIKQRSDTAANWTTKDPVIGNGELIIVETSAGEKRFKVGDGEKTFTQLPYADENILSKIKNYTAGDGISISDTGVISSTGGGSGSDVFVIELDDAGENIANTTYSEIKTAITNNRVIQIKTGQFILPAIAYIINDNDIAFAVSTTVSNNSPYTYLIINGHNETSYTYFTEPLFNLNNSELSNSGAAYWNATNKKWEIKDITSTTYKAGNGISISDDGTISITAAKIYSGTSDTPSADLGENGDIYIQTEG